MLINRVIAYKIMFKPHSNFKLCVQFSIKPFSFTYHELAGDVCGGLETGHLQFDECELFMN